MHLIAITGKKGHGKSTLSSKIIELYPQYEVMSFATPLKNICAELYGLSDEQLYGNKKEVIDPRWNKSPRQIMQFVGTDLFRKHYSEFFPDIGENIWVDILDKKLNDDGYYIIDDLRFENELEFIRSKGGKVIFIERPDLKNNDTHSSETAILDHDYYFENIKNVDITNQDIYNIMNQFFPISKKYNLYDENKYNYYTNLVNDDHFNNEDPFEVYKYLALHVDAENVNNLLHNCFNSAHLTEQQTYYIDNML